MFSFDHEMKSLFPRGCVLIGIDEAGRGSLAGPVVAAAVALSPDFFDPGLNDSKLLSPRERASLFEKIKKTSLYAIGVGSVSLIDSVNILRASLSAMKSALENLLSGYPALKPGIVLMDGPHSPETGYRQKSVIRGDCLSASIAAASVMAKVTRDEMMRDLDRRYPSYGFALHKGYGTSRHIRNLSLYGPTPEHRRSFSPVRDLEDRGDR